MSKKSMEGSVRSAAESATPAVRRADEASVAFGTVGELYSDFADEPEFAELIAVFVAGLPERVLRIEEALDAGNLAEVGSGAHQLRGAGGGYGFSAISVAAATLEDAVQSQQSLADLQRAACELGRTCRAARAGLPVPLGRVANG